MAENENSEEQKTAAKPTVMGTAIEPKFIGIGLAVGLAVGIVFNATVAGMVIGLFAGVIAGYVSAKR